MTNLRTALLAAGGMLALTTATVATAQTITPPPPAATATEAAPDAMAPAAAAAAAPAAPAAPAVTVDATVAPKVGATVKGADGASVGKVTALNTETATLKLTSGKEIRVPRAGIAATADGLAIGMSAAELNAAAGAATPAKKPKK